MKEFKEKIAVITGAASGIGRAIANRCAKEGMKVVLADIEENALKEVEEELKSITSEVQSKKTDVSKATDVEALAQETFETFEEIHLLCNNAGVGAGGKIMEHSLNDWKWVMGVNLWGVIHGVHYFVPRMLEQDAESHVVNTGSGWSLVAGDGAYGVTKYGILALTEMLSHQLKQQSTKVKVSILIPGLINTRIGDSERNRPEQFKNPPLDPKQQRKRDRHKKFYKKVLAAGMAPEKVAYFLFEGIKNERFYILTDAGQRNAVKDRMNGILQAMDKIPRLDEGMN
ncbi:MAG: SDR family NAD(P)-dependent oxidoreductase [Candidatus Hodarchaeota archaeon]